MSDEHFEIQPPRYVAAPSYQHYVRICEEYGYDPKKTPYIAGEHDLLGRKGGILVVDQAFGGGQPVTAFALLAAARRCGMKVVEVW